MLALNRLRSTITPIAATLAIGLLALALPACAQTKAVAPAAPPAKADAAKSSPVAEIGGQMVTQADLEASISAQLAQLDKQRKQLLQDSLTQVIEERLLEREAASRGVTKDELIRTEITAKAGEVTDADVDTWYEQNKARLGGRSKEQLSGQIKQFLNQQKSVGVRTAYLDSLRVKYPVRILLEPDRVTVAAKGPAKGGPASAPVTIVEFSDFECPFCGRVNPAIEEVMKTYGDKVRLVFRQFPLPIHAAAPKAAEAALCADEQGKFWVMHDELFKDQRNIGVDALKAKAAALSLDTAKFNECLDSGRTAAQVQADLADGQKAGVSGTPAFFINGRELSGAQPVERFKALIDEELMRRAPAAK